MNWYLEVLRKYAVFDGRARRKEYWMFFLFNLIIAFLLGLILGVIGVSESISSALCGVYLLAVLIPGLAVCVRRFHDSGRSGWWVLVGLVPVVGGIAVLIFMLLDSEPGSNQYGPNPKGVGA